MLPISNASTRQHNETMNRYRSQQFQNKLAPQMHQPGSASGERSAQLQGNCAPGQARTLGVGGDTATPNMDGLCLHAPEALPSQAVHANDSEVGEAPEAAPAAAAAASWQPAGQVIAATQRLPDWRPDANMHAMLCMAKAGYLDDAEISSLEQQLPAGWNVDTAITHSAKYSVRAHTNTSAKAHNTVNPSIPNPESGGAPRLHPPPAELVTSLRMAANGYLDERDLLEFQGALPAGWNLTQAIHVFESDDEVAQRDFLQALNDMCGHATAAAAETGEPQLHCADLTLIPQAAMGSAVEPAACAAASSDRTVSRGHPTKPKRRSLQSLLSFFKPKWG